MHTGMHTTNFRAHDPAVWAGVAELREEGDEQVRCPDTNEMAAYLDSVMESRERAAWDGHFRRCEKCRRAMAELAELMELVPVAVDQDVIDAGMSLVPAAGLSTSPTRSVNTTHSRG